MTIFADIISNEVHLLSTVLSLGICTSLCGSALWSPYSKKSWFDSLLEGGGFQCECPLVLSLCLTPSPVSETWMEKPAFATALEEHLKRSNREIALPIEACVMMLLETGMKEEVATVTIPTPSILPTAM